MSRFSFSSLSDAPAPLAAIEIAGHRVSGAVLDERGGRMVVSAHAMEALPEQALVPALNAANVRDRAAVVAALGRVMDEIGRPRRVGLVVADPVVKVSLVKLQQVPARAQDLDQVIRWQVRKTAPFAIEEAQVSHTLGLRADDGQEFVVTLARRDVVLEYESLCAAAGAHAGIVDLSTFNAVNAVLAGGPPTSGDWLLVNVAPDWASIAIMRGPHLVFFRSRSAEGEGTLADLVHQTAMYYEDRLGGAGFGRVLLCGGASAGELDRFRRSLSERLGTQVEPVDPLRAAALTNRIAAAPAQLDSLGPLIGMVLRTREVAA
jgi:Tfp pilus assembly PilM family ATPase